jgi:hypothetical protein
MFQLRTVKIALLVLVVAVVAVLVSRFMPSGS